MGDKSARLALSLAAAGAALLLLQARRKRRSPLDALKKIRGTFGLPGTKAFEEHLAKARGNNVCAPGAPSVTIEAACTEDVQAAVVLAAAGERLGMWSGSAPLAVCGGGHSEHCVVDGGVVLLMHRMAHVAVDPQAQTVSIGGGATFGAVLEACAAHGLAMPSGTVGSVGLGAVLCGGVGKLTRKCGMATDSIVEAELVLADGRVRVLREGVAADANLLWAVRGCGLHFGVVTRLIVRLCEVSGARRGGATEDMDL